ncbi:MAG: TnpV protein [Bacilli bacterium]
MNLKYTKQGDYLLPNLTIETNNTDEKINQYGLLRLQFIKSSKKTFYTTLLMNSELQKHLLSVSKICNERYKTIMNDFIKSDKKLT